MAYNKYIDYKDSDHKQLGNIPYHWNIFQLKRGLDLLTDYEANGSFSSVKENVNISEDNKYAWYVRATDLENGHIADFEKCHWVDEESYVFLSKTKLKGEELLIAKRGEIGKVYVMPKVSVKATLAPNMYLIKLNKYKLVPKYVYYYLNSVFGKDQLRINDNSTTIGALYKDDCKSILILYPTINEQNAIIKFLDNEVNRIDSLIEKKQTFIETIKEKRISIISNAVTKGLKSYTELKDSQINWLEKIPKHWEEKALKYTCSINDEALPETTDPEYEFNYVDIGSIDKTLGIVKKEKYIFDEAPSRARRIVKDGDIIVSTVRTYLRAIAPVINPEDNLIVSTGFAVIRPRKINSRYLAYLLASKYFVEKVVSMSVGVSYPAINSSALASIKIPIPEQNEQVQIADYLDKETTSIDRLIELTEKHIEKLQEYKIALISSVVTGKVKVTE